MMKKFYLAVITLLLANTLFAVTRYWVGTTGIYSVGTNWNTMSDGSGTPGVPSNTDDIVIDRNATLIIDAAYAPSSLSIINNSVVNFLNASTTSRAYTIGGSAVSPSFRIESGCTFNITGTAAITLAITSGSAASILGTLDITGFNSKMDYSFGGGITTVKTGGKIRYGGASSNGTGSTSTLQLEAGSTYEIYKDGGSFPTGTYHPNSLLLNTGAIVNAATFSMNTSTGSYGNYVFNAPGYMNTTTGFNNNLTVNNFTIDNDGSGKWIYSTNSSTAYTLTINGNLLTVTGTTLDINAAASGSQATILLVKGDLLNNGTITESNGNTGALIEIGGTAFSSFSTLADGITNDVSLKINKAVGTSVVALTDITLPNTAFSRVTLTSGHIDMQTNNKLLFIQNPAFTALTGGTTNSHIIGKLKRNSNQVGGYAFPVSNNSDQLGKATITTTNTNTTGWTVDFLPVNTNSGSGLTPGVIDVVAGYAWDIARTESAPSDVDFISLSYGDLTTSQVIIPAQVKVVHWNGTTWDNLGGTDGGGSVENSLGSSGGTAPADPISSFGIFSIGGTTGVIPISIEYLEGAKNNNNHTLSWKVNCTNSLHVTLILERSGDGRNFTGIYEITADALRCRQPFDRVDDRPLQGLNYYRLKMIDTDGKVYYSKTIGLLNKIAGFEILSVSPNPVSDGSRSLLHISSAQNDHVEIIMTDMSGRLVRIQKNVLFIGNNELQLPMASLPAGAYQITVMNGSGNKQQIRFLKD